MNGGKVVWIFRGIIIALDSEDLDSEVFEHPHLAYITKEKWNEIQQELESRTKTVSESAAPSIFGTLLQCACGGTIRTDSTNKSVTKRIETNRLILFVIVNRLLINFEFESLKRLMLHWNHQSLSFWAIFT